MGHAGRPSRVAAVVADQAARARQRRRDGSFDCRPRARRVRGARRRHRLRARRRGRGLGPGAAEASGAASASATRARADCSLASICRATGLRDVAHRPAGKRPAACTCVVTSSYRAPTPGYGRAHIAAPSTRRDRARQPGRASASDCAPGGDGLGRRGSCPGEGEPALC